MLNKYNLYKFPHGAVKSSFLLVMVDLRRRNCCDMVGNRHPPRIHERRMAMWAAQVQRFVKLMSPDAAPMPRNHPLYRQCDAQIWRRALRSVLRNRIAQ